MIALIMALAVAAPAADAGPLLILADARRVLAAAQADAARRNVGATLAVVDPYGELVLVQTAPDARGAAADAAVLQARALLNDGAEALDDQSHHGVAPGAARAGGGAALLISRGKIIGAIGDVGRDASAVAKAGAGALK